MSHVNWKPSKRKRQRQRQITERKSILYITKDLCTFPATSYNSTCRRCCLSTFNAVVNCLLLLLLLAPPVDADAAVVAAVVLSLNPLRLIILPVLLSVVTMPLSMPVSPRYESMAETVDSDSQLFKATFTWLFCWCCVCWRNFCFSTQ